MWRGVLLAGGLLGSAGVAVPTASAASLPAAVTASPAADSEHPVKIEVDGFEPRVLSPGAVITISGTLRNTGDATVTRLGLRLQRGAALATRGQLTAADEDPDPDTTAVPAFKSLSGQLQPGATMNFSYSIAASALQLDAAGVYPALLNANGTVQGTEQRVGELDTYLIEPPTTATARTTVAWLWPLVDRTHRDASGRFTDDDLAREVATNGRLDRALTTIERLPRATAPGATQPTPTVPVTLAVDPQLVEELQVMAAGSYRVGDQQGKGTQAAAAFLQRLKAVAATVPVVALPYGDVDADALQSAGLPGVVTRSLPGTADGTAHDGRVTGSPASASPSGSDTAGAGTGAGAQLLAAALGVHPRTDLAWLPSGTVHPETLGTLQKGGVDEVVLPAAALTGGDGALGLGRTTAAAATSVTAPAGALPALVGDSRLGQLADADSTAGGPRVAEQRYLAELTLLSTQAPASATPTVLVTPPRTVDADPDAADAMMTETTTTPWLQASTAQSLVAIAAGAHAALAAPASTSALDPTGMSSLSAAVSVRDAVADAAVRDPAVALAPQDAAIARAASIEWRDDTAGFRKAAVDVRTTMNRLADRVTLVAPADGTYSLASNDAPLVLTVRNDLPFAVQVLLKLQTTSVGLQLGDIGRQTLLPGQLTTLQVPTQVRHLGGFSVTAALTTPDGAALGDPVRIRVRSTAYGPIGLFITIGAGALLGLLFLRRLIRFLRRRRGGPPPDALPEPTAEGAPVPQPPTRSPV